MSLEVKQKRKRILVGILSGSSNINKVRDIKKNTIYVFYTHNGFFPKILSKKIVSKELKCSTS